MAIANKMGRLWDISRQNRQAIHRNRLRELGDQVKDKRVFYRECRNVFSGGVPLVPQKAKSPLRRMG